MVLGGLQGVGHCVAAPWVSDLGRLQHSKIVSFHNILKFGSVQVPFPFLRSNMKGFKSGFNSFLLFNKVSVRQYYMKKANNNKHRPELGACPCMRVGGFKRNPTGFSSVNMEHKG